MSDRTLTEIEFEYAGGGYFREKGVAVGDKAVIAHAPELVTAFRAREAELERELTCEHGRPREYCAEAFNAAIDKLTERAEQAESERDALRAEVAELKRARLCRRHFDGPNAENYGNDGCAICVLNRAEQAEAESAALEREVAAHRAVAQRSVAILAAANTKAAALEREVERLRENRLADFEAVVRRWARPDLAPLMLFVSDVRAALSPPKETPDCGCGMGDACERYDAPSGD